MWSREKAECVPREYIPVRGAGGLQLQQGRWGKNEKEMFGLLVGDKKARIDQSIFKGRKEIYSFPMILHALTYRFEQGVLLPLWQWGLEGLTSSATRVPRFSRRATLEVATCLPVCNSCKRI